MTYTYTPSGVCSRQIDITLHDETDCIESIRFYGGCNGNLKGIAALAKGKKPAEIIDALKGIQCGMKGTSCPDQLARALEQIMAEL